MLFLPRPKKSPQVILAESATRTATYRSPMLQSRTDAGILVYLHVTAASGTGGLSVRINAREPDYSAGAGTPWETPLNTAPTAVTTIGDYLYLLYPATETVPSWNGTAQTTRSYLPQHFSITVQHADASDYTYSVGYQLLPY